MISFIYTKIVSFCGKDLSESALDLAKTMKANNVVLTVLKKFQITAENYYFPYNRFVCTVEVILKKNTNFSKYSFYYYDQ